MAHPVYQQSWMGDKVNHEATYAPSNIADPTKIVKVGGYAVSDPKVVSSGQINTVFPTTSSKRVRSCGPWGGDGGMGFNDGVYTGVREVHITRSGGMVSIRVCYDQNGRAVWGNKNGGMGGLKSDKIVFDYPFEILTHITGYYGSTILRGPIIVKSITFHTNRRSYGPFGDPQGFSFSSGNNGVIVGFHGRKGYFVHSIGVHVLEGQPMIIPSQPQPHAVDMSTMNNSEVVWGLPPPAPYGTGPWGSEAGQPWDDGVYTGVRKIILTRGEVICSIQVEYDRNGRSVWGAPHGTSYDSCTYSIKFDYPSEVLISMSGYYDTLYGDTPKRVIRSLTFHTNKGKYGPYGKEIGTYFTSANTEGRVVGFHGRSGYFLDAIGVHMQYWVADGTSNHRYPTEKGPITSMLSKLF